MTILVFHKTPRAQRDAVINLHVVADVAGFANHHARAVINEEIRSDARDWMNINPRATVRPLGLAIR